MMSWNKPLGMPVPHAGPPHPPHHPHAPLHVWDGKHPHEHLYDACEAILANQTELLRQFEELRAKFAQFEQPISRTG